MQDQKVKALASLVIALTLFLVFPQNANAVVQSLNGETGQTQTFQNDSNVTISSASNIHTLGWQGLLPVSRGGTGASSFTSGSLFFFNGSTFAENNSNLFWDNNNNRLGIGTTQPKGDLEVVGTEPGLGISVTSPGTFPVGLILNNDTEERGGVGLSIGDGFFANEALSEDTVLYSYNPSGDSRLILATGDNPNARLTITGSGDIGIANIDPQAKLDVTGTIRGDSTMFLGNTSTPGCITMADSDGSGVTYVTANDGVLIASSTKPSFCQ